MIHAYQGAWPKVASSAYIADGAHVIGDVEIGDDSSVWFNCVIRGDVHYVRIGRSTNVQDGSICHAMRDECPLIVGSYVTVGHGAVLHGCSVESHCLIGIRATVLNGASIGSYSIVAAGAVVPENTVIPPRSLVMGVPAKVRREVTREEMATIGRYADRYVAYKETYLKNQTDPPGGVGPSRRVL